MSESAALLAAVLASLASRPVLPAGRTGLLHAVLRCALAGVHAALCGEGLDCADCVARVGIVGPRACMGWAGEIRCSVSRP